MRKRKTVNNSFDEKEEHTEKKTEIYFKVKSTSIKT